MKSETFRIEAMPADVVKRLRETRVDDVGNALVTRKDGGRHQCRCCLRLTDAWEGYLAVSYAPMPGSHPFVERGPVYIHERQCDRYREVDGYPAEMPRTEIVLRAYGETNEIEDARMVAGTPVENAIRELLANPSILYIHARNAAYGCFMFRIMPARRAADAGA
jgi:hypothetical protein